jgi:hypothetical protein
MEVSWRKGLNGEYGGSLVTILESFGIMRRKMNTCALKAEKQLII